MPTIAERYVLHAIASEFNQLKHNNLGEEKMGGMDRHHTNLINFSNWGVGYPFFFHNLTFLLFSFIDCN